jgi:hypothetical protein
LPTTYYGFNYTCLTACPQYDYQFNPTATFANDVSYTCNPLCPSVSARGDPLYYDYINFKCVTNCPIGAPYAHATQDRICYLQCPVGYYNDNVTMTCMNFCFNNLNESIVIIYKNYSLWQYSPTFNGVNGKCVSSCPLNSWADPLTLKCVHICPNSNIKLFTDSSTGINRCI